MCGQQNVQQGTGLVITATFINDRFLAPNILFISKNSAVSVRVPLLSNEITARRSAFLEDNAWILTSKLIRHHQQCIETQKYTFKKEILPAAQW